MICNPLVWPPTWCTVMPGAISPVAVVEADAVAEHAPDHRGHVFRLERAADVAVAHAAPGAERHLAVLNVKRRVREQIVVAGVVVMHVADDDILDPVRIDADRQEPVARRTQKLAPALFRHRRVEAGVEDQRPALADNGPDEIVERHRPVMRVAAVEIVSRRALVVRIAHGIDLIGVAAHGCPPLPRFHASSPSTCAWMNDTKAIGRRYPTSAASDAACQIAVASARAAGV